MGGIIVTSNKNSDETGIIIAAEDINGYGWILLDASLKAPAKVWVKKVIELFEEYNIDKIIVETNQGGDLIEEMLRAECAHVPLKKIHATKSKKHRAEPVSNLYEREKIIHVKGLSVLENQLCSYDGKGKSPDRMDALVWALSEVFLKPFQPKPKSWDF